MFTGYFIYVFTYLFICFHTFCVFRSDDFNTSHTKAAVFEAAFLSIRVERLGKLMETLNQNSLSRVEWNVRAICLRPSLFWDVTQPLLEVSYLLFGTVYWSDLQGSSSPIPIGCPEMSVTNYQLMLRNIPEGRRYHLQSGRSLKS